MSTEIKEMKELINPHAAISDANLKLFYPKTHMKAVVDDEGNTLVNVFESFHDEVMEEASDMIADAQRDINTAISEYAPIEITGDVNNAADEEDLTSVSIGGTDVIRLKDKAYAPTIYSGLGKKYMRKNMVGGVNILTQSMMPTETGDNTVYVIQYDYDLNGAEITIPTNCVLKFEGGSLRNGTLVGQGTKINAGDVKIFHVGTRTYRGYTINNVNYNAIKSSEDALVISGTWDNDSVKKEWFGLGEDNSDIDCSHIIRYMMEMLSSEDKSIPKAIYGVFDYIILSKNFNGNGSIFKLCKFTDVYNNSIELPSGASPLDSSIYPHGLSGKYGYIRCGSGLSTDIEISNFTIDGINVTSEDLPFNTWGIYGLYCSQEHKDTTVRIKNVTFKNSLQCLAFPTTVGFDVFDSCLFEGCGEHCIYTRQVSGYLVVTNCIFNSWGYLDGYSNISGKDCHAIKYQSNINRENDISITIESCKFYKGSGLSNYVLSIYTDQININDSEFEICYALLRNNLNNNRSLVTINNCKYPPFNAGTISENVIQKIVIYNSICSYGNLADAVILDNCDLDARYSTLDADVRKYGINSLISDIKTILLSNCRINLDASIAKKFIVNGCYTAIFKGCIFYLNNRSSTTNVAIGFNKKDVESSTIYFEDCSYDHGKQLIGIQASSCDFVLNNSVFKCSRTVTSGYVNRALIFSSANSIKINNSRCVADDEGFIAPLYGNNVNVSYVNPIMGTSQDYYNSFKGQLFYNDSLNKTVLWNGARWVESDGAKAGVNRSGTFTQKPSASDIYAGFKYFCTDKQTAEGQTNGIEIIHKGNDEWVDALGRVVS